MLLCSSTQGQLQQLLRHAARLQQLHTAATPPACSQPASIAQPAGSTSQEPLAGTATAGTNLYWRCRVLQQQQQQQHELHTRPQWQQHPQQAHNLQQLWLEQQHRRQHGLLLQQQQWQWQPQQQWQWQQPPERQQQQRRWQPLRAYHPATHAARALTSKLRQQRSWQDLRLVFDASGGGAKLNPIQLSALLQQLCKLAPAPGLLNAADRDSLTAFVDELTAACWAKLQRFDATGLANVVNNILRLQGTLGWQPEDADTPDDSSSSSSSRASGSSRTVQPLRASLHAELLAAATKQIAYANCHAAGMLLAALTKWQQRQQRQQQQQQRPATLQELQQQVLEWQQLLAALTQRLETCVAMKQLTSADASKLCLATSKLAGLLAQLRASATTAAVAAAPVQLAQPHHHQQQQQQQPSGAGQLPDVQEVSGRLEGINAPESRAPAAAAAAVAAAGHDLQLHCKQLQQAARTLLALAAQQVVQGSNASSMAAAAPADRLANTSRVVYALAKTWAWPGWPAVLDLVNQYSTALQAAGHMLAAESEPAHFSSRGAKKQRQQLGPPAFLMLDSSSGGMPGRQHTEGVDAADAAAAA